MFSFSFVPLLAPNLVLTTPLFQTVSTLYYHYHYMFLSGLNSPLSRDHKYDYKYTNSYSRTIILGISHNFYHVFQILQVFYEFHAIFIICLSNNCQIFSTNRWLEVCRTVYLKQCCGDCKWNFIKVELLAGI